MQEQNPPITSKIYTLEDLRRFSTITEVPYGSFARYCSTPEKEKSMILDHEWNYYINPYGFRDPWNIGSTNTKIGFYGCSFTFGVGLPTHQTFSHLVKEKLTPNQVDIFNIGVGGGSIHRIAKLLAGSIELLELDLVVLTLPTYLRFLVIDENLWYHDLLPNFKITHSNELDAKRDHLYKLFSEHDFESIAGDYIQWMLAELSKKNIKSVWSSWDEATYNVIKAYVDPSMMFPKFSHIEGDVARDQVHPGPIVHNLYADQIVDVIKRNYLI